MTRRQAAAPVHLTVALAPFRSPRQAVYRTARRLVRRVIEPACPVCARQKPPRLLPRPAVRRRRPSSDPCGVSVESRLPPAPSRLPGSWGRLAGHPRNSHRRRCAGRRLGRRILRRSWRTNELGLPETDTPNWREWETLSRVGPDWVSGGFWPTASPDRRLWPDQPARRNNCSPASHPFVFQRHTAGTGPSLADMPTASANRLTPAPASRSPRPFTMARARPGPSYTSPV